MYTLITGHIQLPSSTQISAFKEPSVYYVCTTYIHIFVCTCMCMHIQRELLEQGICRSLQHCKYLPHKSSRYINDMHIFMYIFVWDRERGEERERVCVCTYVQQELVEQGIFSYLQPANFRLKRALGILCAYRYVYVYVYIYIRTYRERES